MDQGSYGVLEGRAVYATAPSCKDKQAVQYLFSGRKHRPASLAQEFAPRAAIPMTGEADHILYGHTDKLRYWMSRFHAREMMFHKALKNWTAILVTRKPNSSTNAILQFLGVISKACCTARLPSGLREATSQNCLDWGKEDLEYWLL